ncbi:hypothetical protein ACHAXS_007503 [Conticribra weissflogii]
MEAKLEFDIVIVGAGASAAGLLHGILERLLDYHEEQLSHDVRDKSTTSNCGASSLANARIVVIERGFNGSVEQTLRRDDASSAEQANITPEEQSETPREWRSGFFRHPHPSTISLRSWFSAAHYSSDNYAPEVGEFREYSKQILDNFAFGKRQNHLSSFHPLKQNQIFESTIPSPTTLHASEPQKYLHHRILDIPTGNGYGGTTNIHAGLVVPPDYKIDFRCWPGRWKDISVDDSTDQIGDVGERRTKERFNEPEQSASTATLDGNTSMDKIKRESRRGLLKNATIKIVNALEQNDALNTIGSTHHRCTDMYQTPELISYLRVCSGEAPPFVQEQHPYVLSEFEKVTNTSSSSRNPSSTSKVPCPHNDTADDTTNRRINYFTALVEPLLQKHPQLQSQVTFLTGMQAERVVIKPLESRLVDPSCDDSCAEFPIDETRIPARKPRAWAVECLDVTTNRHVLIRSKKEIVLCAGAIGSPSLLLSSGIGHEDDLKSAGIIPWYEQHDNDHRREQPQKQRGPPLRYVVRRDLPVGRNLRDHILLPRSFVTPRQDEMASSCNSIHGWWSINCSRPTEDSFAKIQLQLADGIQMDTMIPHFAACIIRRHWTISSFSYGNIRLPRGFVSFLFQILRRLLKSMLQLFPPVGELVRRHTATVNICLMNPRSTGRVTISSKRPPRTGGTSGERFTRLSDCRVIVDPSYLSDARDIDALYSGWKASSDIKRLWYGSCIEILPGCIFLTLSWLFSIFRRLKYLFYAPGVVRPSTKETSTSIGWFPFYAAEFVMPYYHWCGTCAMGEESADNVLHDGPSEGRNAGRDAEAKETFVVDETLCVRGLNGLRVCDASVFPTCISAPTALTCAAVGYVASGILIKRHYE